jgi:hypothetical protein
MRKTYKSEYKAWASMKQRCLNPNNNNWKHYGGRGITVCSEWRDSFHIFFRDMGAKPSANYSLDRIDNNGNYEPSNCRWATQTTQTMNRRLKDGGVSFLGENVPDSLKNKYQAKIMKNGKSHSLGCYDTKEEAIEARKRGEKIYHGRLFRKDNSNPKPMYLKEEHIDILDMSMEITSNMMDARKEFLAQYSDLTKEQSSSIFTYWIKLRECLKLNGG